MEPIVIARLAAPKMVRTIVLQSVVLAVVLWCLLAMDFGDKEIRKWMALPFLPLPFFWFAAVILQLCLHRGDALWIADGKLIWKWGSRHTAALEDIEDVVIEDVSVEVAFMKPRVQKYIVVKLHGDREMHIDFTYLSEPASVVLARLRDALRLPKTI